MTNKNLVFQASVVDASTRAFVKGQRPIALWLTGLSGAGKSTIANALEVAMVERGRHTYLLDGDNVRMGLCRDLGFSDADREENIRRIAEVARLFVDAGLIVISAFISPFQRDRALAREVIGSEAFVEVFIDTPLAECERRDPKGLYGKARSGAIKNFTGIDSAYEGPVNPDIRINTLEENLPTAVGRILAYLDERGLA
ncbi:adenylyl-sulfate kinase [Pseudomonas chlororaphis]|uniref:adenylyl-sulfate kinase n=1 Tax=Pseudomonas chlororaphis TaxID=587753 RepID=UPI0003D2EB8B|nr:adenylyl-sulfate kinase [Pseudomonas chlororaphis]AZD30990.1 Adenylylsulfate kinase [Pseudomonas chlororaphis]ETD39856.1 adenylylsulfate kinase [Pseudomonas chlororaphis subsp. aurantiaca PB-St2]QFS56328.1 adenylyl-sulfate kinase [Pseudomonas chlororaphis subsp. aurantiaca]